MNSNIELNKNKLENIGKRLRSLIVANGMPQKDFATLAGITPQTLSKIINGKYVSLSIRLIEKFSQLLHVSTDYLLCQSDNPGGGNLIGSDDWLDRNAQDFYILNVKNYLESINYTFTEKFVIGELQFVPSSNMLKLIGSERKSTLLKYGFPLEDTTDIDCHIEYECTVDDLFKVVLTAENVHIDHFWEIEYQGNLEKVDELQFKNMMYSFALLTQNYFAAALTNLTNINVKLSDIGMAIKLKKNEEGWKQIAHSLLGNELDEPLNRPLFFAQQKGDSQKEE